MKKRFWKFMLVFGVATFCLSYFSRYLVDEGVIERNFTFAIVFLPIYIIVFSFISWFFCLESSEGECLIWCATCNR